ncbi:sigma-70 family RNA polymerase sigma factor [Spirillospora sp. NPDC052269]
MRNEAPTPVAQTIVFVDVQFAGRTAGARLAARDALHEAMATTLTEAGVSRENIHQEDRGDGLLILIPSEVPQSRLAGHVSQRLTAALDRHNRGRVPEARIRVRMAVHTGQVHHDDHGSVGAALNFTCRLLDSPALKNALARSSGNLAVIVSDRFFQEVVRGDPTGSPGTYQCVQITVQGTHATAWIHLIDDPQPRTRASGKQDPQQAPDRPSEREVHPDGRGFEEFYRTNFRTIRNIVNARAQDWTLAEDVTDQAMMIAYRKWDDLHEHPNPIGFVVVTARRILSRTQRQRAKASPPAPHLSLDANPGLQLQAQSGNPADLAITRTALNQALKALPVDQRECFVLHEILDHPIRTIAQLLNLPEGTIKTRLRAARLALRELLHDDLGEGNAR